MSSQLRSTQVRSDNVVLNYLVREPKITSLRTKAIILLHGVGSNEQDLFGLAEYLPDEFYVIAARGQYTLGPGRFAWYNVDFSAGKPVIDAGQELASRQVIGKFIAEVRVKYSLDEVYLGGFSQGAIMSYSVGLIHPEEVNGVVALSGRILAEIRPSVTINEKLQSLKVFLAHGIQDSTLPVDYAKEAKVYLKKIGVNLTYREYPIGHQINDAVLKDLNAWLGEK